MDPPIENSIAKIRQDCWRLGSRIICEIVSEASECALVSWAGDDGQEYCIRELSMEEKAMGASAKLFEYSPYYHAGTSSAVWNIGGIYFKAKSWCRGMQLESNTIHYVTTISSVPAPQVIYTWVDSDWDRSFLILRGLKGQTLYNLWPRLSLDQRSGLAGRVAHFCRIIALSTSEKLETADGKGIVEPFLTPEPPASEPSWKPQPFGPHSLDELGLNGLGDSALATPQERLCFYHADLGPTNIIVDEHGELVGILDWESAAFYPVFWVGTKPLVSAGFFLQGLGVEKKAWAHLLADALGKEGFTPDMKRYLAWRKSIQI